MERTDKICADFLKTMKKEVKAMKEKPEIKIVENLSTPAFIGYLIMVGFFFITNFGDELTLWDFGNRAFMFLVYVIGMAIILVLQMKKPSFGNFIKDMTQLVFDDRIPPEQKAGMLKTQIINLVGYIADLSFMNVPKDEEKK